jgi:PIN domain nuclease of toxin-antitoxin system
MKDEYDEHAKKYFKTKEEFELDRIRNYFSPISTYFEIKAKIEKGEIPNDKKESIMKLLEECEKECKINIKKITKVLHYKTQ